MNKEDFELRFPGKNYEDYSPHPNGGGLVAKTAYVETTAQIKKNATVHDYARVCNSAIIGGNATVSDYASVLNNAEVFGDAIVSGNAFVRGDAVVRDSAHVHGNASVTEYAVVCGDALVNGNVIVREIALVCGDVIASGNVIASGSMRLFIGIFTKTPYSIKLSKHTLTIQGDGSIAIGCEHHSLKHWLEHGRTIGKLYGYTSGEIDEAYDMLTKIKEGEIK